MFKCDHCGGIQSPKAKRFLLTIEWRLKKYPDRKVKIPGTNKVEIIPGSIGYEIVRQIEVCGACFDELSQLSRPVQPL